MPESALLPYQVIFSTHVVSNSDMFSLLLEVVEGRVFLTHWTPLKRNYGPGVHTIAILVVN